MQKKFLYISIPLLIIAAGFGFYIYSKSNDSSSDVPENTGQSSDGINYSPPTQADAEENDRHKAELGSEDNSDNQTTAGKKQVKPEIATVDQTSSKIEVSARVPGVIEDGGTCTFTFTRAGSNVSKKSTGVSNVSETSCGFVSIDKTTLSKGTWSLSVKYGSNKASGTSSSEQIEVK